MQIGARGNADAIFPSGAQMALFWGWSTALPAAALQALNLAARARFSA
jgi:hypothetical protein